MRAGVTARSQACSPERGLQLKIRLRRLGWLQHTRSAAAAADRTGLSDNAPLHLRVGAIHHREVAPYRPCPAG
ncbi:hypothetical protein NDU88_005959 [Pleurodeles waltl]|uniref:Uncharacterized protein n=1 Tax=Pleurodeles waltl TaxID=8319 RepID=A0AAV7NNZ8_PLEWA|nr:hypothetical protein NDU88_005959 [Pleurodeles waltl]